MESFTDLVEPFSINEQFMDVTGSTRLYGSAEEIVRAVQQIVLLSTGVKVRIGIAPTKVLAKMALDNFAKRHPDGIYRLDETNLLHSEKFLSKIVIVIIIGLILRTDHLGMTSLIRDFYLHPRGNETMIHFLSSSARSLESLRLTWLQVVAPCFP